MQTDHEHPHQSRTKSPRSIKIGKSVTDTTSNNAHQFQGHKVKGQDLGTSKLVR